MDTRDHLSQRQREALWKWRWLGWRESTPAFKACLALVAFAVLAFVILLGRI